MKGIKEERPSLEELMDRYQAEAYRYSVFLMGNREDAWDLLQETWIQVYKKLPGLRDIACFKSWFYQILTRNGWKMKKRKNREVPVEDIFDYIIQEQQDSSENRLIGMERNEILMKEIQKLKPKLKIAVILYYYNEFSIEEIGKITGSLPSTVKSRLFQARKQLKKALEEEEGEWRIAYGKE